ncbi:MAG: hypothetical protein ACFFBR_09135 [Promethearchaeota archaeon]
MVTIPVEDTIIDSPQPLQSLFSLKATAFMFSQHHVVWFRMGQKDLEYAYERYKFDRNLIKPYANEMEMANRIKGYEAHFFPWTRWMLTFFFGVAMFAGAAIVWISYLWIYGSISLIGMWNLVPVGFVCGGIVAWLASIPLRRKYMVVSVDGISLPRVFGPNQNIPWETITRLSYRTTGLEESVTLIIETTSEKVKTNLSYYKIIYFARVNKGLYLARALLTYMRMRVLGQSREQVEKALKQPRTRHGLQEAVAGIVLFVWIAVGRFLVTLYGWLLFIPVIPMGFALFFMMLNLGSYYQTRKILPSMRKALVISIISIIVCTLVILILIIPFLP